MSIMSCQEVKCRMREESSRPLETTSSPNSLEDQEKEVAQVFYFDNFNYNILYDWTSSVLISRHMSVRLDRLQQSISLFFSSDNESWEASDDPEKPCRWPWYCNRKHRKDWGKNNLLYKHYGSSNTNTKLPVSLGPLYGFHLIQRLLASVQFTHVTISTGPAKIIIIMPSSGMAIIGGHEHNLPIIISEIFPGTAVARSNRVRLSCFSFPKLKLTKSLSRSMQAT